MTMIEFRGSRKAFFKAYPKDKRSFDEVYCLVSYNVITKQESKVCYQFIGSLGEKNFKRVCIEETPVKQIEPNKCDYLTIIADLKEKVDSIISENKLMSEEIAKLKSELKDKLSEGCHSRIDKVESALNEKIDKKYKRLSAETWILKTCINNHYDAFHSIKRDLKVAKLEEGRNEVWFYSEK